MVHRKPQDWREARRRRAWELKQQGWQQNQIAEALGVTARAVSQWINKAKQAGIATLYGRRGGGPTPRLSEEQVATLPTLLDKGAAAYGFRGEGWTRSRVARVIKQAFGVSFTP